MLNFERHTAREPSCDVSRSCAAAKHCQLRVGLILLIVLVFGYGRV